ncbi:hypothetical protein M0811_05977 [Anaeramoeba ignava]|uniref:BTB domain-containing protein n=1 Tax=Anaeramoeba ignava TaxID=1746090 RepID=A0A9Q0REU2_ANAIG|nr:hypothetical protein M0811_05977 [Anaeramoeba ignava]
MLNNFAWGYNKYTQLGFTSSEEKIDIPQPFSILENETFKMIASAISSTTFINSRDELIVMGSDQKKTWKMEKQIDFIKIFSGSSIFFGLSTDNKVYCWGSDLFEKSSKAWIPDKPLEMLKDFKVIDIAAGASQYYILLDDHTLYTYGHDALPETQFISKYDLPQWKKLMEKISKIYSGNDAHFFFAITLDNKLYSAGLNSSGQLGIGDLQTSQSPKIVNFPQKIENIIDIQCGYYFSLVLVLENKIGQVYSSGSYQHNGLNLSKNAYTFQKIMDFENENITQISSGCAHSLALNDKNEIFVWGTNSYSQLGFITQNSLKPTKIQIENLNINNSLIVYAGTLNSFVYTQEITSLVQEFKDLLDNQEFCDDNITFLNGFKNIHSLVLEMRIGNQKIQVLKSILNKCTESTANQILKWIYTGSFSYEIQDILIQLGFNSQEISEKSNYSGLLKDLKHLNSQEKSKDFAIIVEGKEVKAHKVVLFARSELFKGMFLSVQDSSNRVNDYSNRNYQTIKILVDYLYSDSLPSNIKKEIIEELEDADDFYQFHSFQNFRKELDKFSIKNKK